MAPERKRIIDDHKVEEFYWASKLVVYIDNRLTHESFDDACNRLQIEYGERLLSEGDMPGGFN